MKVKGTTSLGWLYLVQGAHLGLVSKFDRAQPRLFMVWGGGVNQFIPLVVEDLLVSKDEEWK